MPKVHFVKSARKENSVAKVGESYYWWQFRFGGKRFSKTYPKRSQLTQSPFLSELYDVEDRIGDSIDEDQAAEIICDLEALRDECQYSLDNMPEHLQEASDSGMLLQERIDNLEDWISEIENIDWESTTPEEAAEIIADANPGF